MIRIISPILSILLMAGAYGGYRYHRASIHTVEAATTSPAAISGAVTHQARDIREQRAMELLAAVGNTQPTSDIVSEVVAWSLAEDSSNGAIERNNPWNTTMCGYNMLGSINSDGACGVQSYATPADGIAANAATLAQGNFSAVADALRANDIDGFKRALWESGWAASHYNGGVGWPVYQVVATSNMVAGKKCPYTDTMQIGDNSSFYSTGSGYWLGQYGGMHLGDDFIGNPGDPVYAPFDMRVESVGEYTDPGRFGKNIQARFAADNTLYYAGHLIDVYVSAGQFVAACEVIATLGATSGPHTHIKLASPNAPVPCESSPPGDGGCIDPIEYWNTH